MSLRNRTVGFLLACTLVLVGGSCAKKILVLGAMHTGFCTGETVAIDVNWIDTATNPAPAYYRVAWKLDGAPSWTYGDWSQLADVMEASVEVSTEGDLLVMVEATLDAAGPRFVARRSAATLVAAADVCAEPEVVATGQGGAWEMEIDSTHVYWTHSSGVRKIAIADGTVTDLATGQLGARTLERGFDYLYWTVYDPSFPSNEGIFRVHKNGGLVEPMVDSNNTEGPGDIAFFGSGFLFTNTFETPARTIRLHYLGDPPNVAPAYYTPPTWQQDYANHDPTAIDAGVDYVYWANFNGGNIERVSTAGGVIQTVATGQDRPTSMTHRVDFFVWANMGRDAIGTASIRGHSDAEGLVTLATLPTEDNPYGLWADSEYVYFVTRGDRDLFPAVPGRINRVARSGGAVEVIVDDLTHPVDLELSADYIYWTDADAGTISRIRR